MPEETLPASNDCTATVKTQLEALIQRCRLKESADTKASKKNYAVDAILDFLEENLEAFSQEKIDEKMSVALGKFLESSCSLERFRIPLLLTCGHTLEYVDLLKLNESCCPECKVRINKHQFFGNKNLLLLISELETLFPFLKKNASDIQREKLEKIFLSLNHHPTFNFDSIIYNTMKEFSQDVVVKFIQDYGINTPTHFGGYSLLSLAIFSENETFARYIVFAIFEKENAKLDKFFGEFLYQYSDDISRDNFLFLIEFFQRALESQVFDKVLLSLSRAIVRNRDLDLFNALMSTYPKIVNFYIDGNKSSPLHYFIHLTDFTEDDLDRFVENGANPFLANSLGRTSLEDLLTLPRGDEVVSQSTLKWSDELLKLINEKVIGYDSEGVPSDRYWLDIVVEKAGIKTMEQLLERSVVDFSKLKKLNYLFYFPYSELVRKKITHRLLAEYLLDSRSASSSLDAGDAAWTRRISALSGKTDLDFELLKHYIDILRKRYSLEGDNEISQFINKLTEKDPAWSDISLSDDSHYRLCRLRIVARCGDFENRYEQQGVIKNAFFEYARAEASSKTDPEKIDFWKRVKSRPVFSQHRMLNPVYSLKALWHWLEKLFTVCHTVKKIEREIQQLEKKQQPSVGCWAGFWSCSKMSQVESSSSSKNLPSNF